jgi:hypothetical protein
VRAFFITLAVVSWAIFAHGSQRLFYLEAQAVGGYTFTGDDSRVYWYSMDQMDVMQKPSLGFDYIQRLSGAGGDWGMLAVQARLAYDSTVRHDVEPQLYNAYLKVKPGFGDIWLGHNKPAFGLRSYLDNHGTLLQPASVQGYNADRDWGIGYSYDLTWGNISFSTTTGSGMPLTMRGNRQISARVALGDFNQRNFVVGVSASYGNIPFQTMGYHEIYNDYLSENKLLSIDASILWNRYEQRSEVIWNRYHSPWFRNYEEEEITFFERLTCNMMSEGRLKVEGQVQVSMHKNYITPILFLVGEKYDTYAVKLDQYAFCISYAITGDLTMRLMMKNEHDPDAIAQLYWYHKL